MAGRILARPVDLFPLHQQQLGVKYKPRCKLGHYNFSPWPQRCRTECIMTFLICPWKIMSFHRKKWNTEYVLRLLYNLGFIRIPREFVKTQMAGPHFLSFRPNKSVMRSEHVLKSWQCCRSREHALRTTTPNLVIKCRKEVLIRIALLLRPATFVASLTL